MPIWRRQEAISLRKSGGRSKISNLAELPTLWHTHTHVHTCRLMHLYAHTWVHMDTGTRAYTLAHMQAHTGTHAYMGTVMH